MIQNDTFQTLKAHVLHYVLSVINSVKPGPVVQRVNNSIQRLSRYPADKMYCNSYTFIRRCMATYPLFEQLVPGKYLKVQSKMVKLSVTVKLIPTFIAIKSSENVNEFNYGLTTWGDVYSSFQRNYVK